MEMGTGKSLTTIAVAGRLFLDHKVERMLIVAPLSILGVWQEEFRKFADFEYSLAILNGSESKKIEKLRQMPTSGLQVAVINYESAWRLEKELAAWDADLIVCDEGHKIKTHNIAASKCMHRLGAKARYRMLLTGTIITNKAIDVFSPYKFLNPAVFGNSFYAFRNRYFDMIGYGNHTPVLKANMAEELTRRIHSIAFRATKAECLDLPETTEIVRTVELEPQAHEAVSAAGSGQLCADQRWRDHRRQCADPPAAALATDRRVLARGRNRSRGTSQFRQTGRAFGHHRQRGAGRRQARDHRAVPAGDRRHHRNAGTEGDRIFADHRRGEGSRRAGASVSRRIPT